MSVGPTLGSAELRAINLILMPLWTARIDDQLSMFTISFVTTVRAAACKQRSLPASRPKVLMKRFQYVDTQTRPSFSPLAISRSTLFDVG